MRSIRAAATGAVMLSLALAASACGGGSSTGGGSNDSPKELTYWASNQGASIEADKKVLQPELDKFEKQTGIKVKLEVVPWSDLLNRILTATTSGQGPDVLNIGNTWSASLQATGALLPWDKAQFDKIGGKDRFVDSALGSTGAEGQRNGTERGRERYGTHPSGHRLPIRSPAARPVTGQARDPSAS